MTSGHFKVAAATLSLALIVGSAPVYADDAAALAKAKHCFECHGAKTEGVGPSFTDIARRFSGLKNAKSMLVSVIEAGSDSPTAIYHWSHIKMPPAAVRVPVSKAEAGVLADYVLGFK
jgi:cytochrome c